MKKCQSSFSLQNVLILFSSNTSGKKIKHTSLLFFIKSYDVKFASSLNMTSKHKYLERLIVQKQHDTCIVSRIEEFLRFRDEITWLLFNQRVYERCLVLLCCDIQFKVASLTSAWNWYVLGKISRFLIQVLLVSVIL